MACASQRLKLYRPLFRYLARHSSTNLASRPTHGMTVSRTRCLLARSFTVSATQRYSATDNRDAHTEQEHRNESSTSQEAESGQGEETQYEYDIRQRILASSLPYVQEFGWTKKALEAGAKDEGLPPIAHGMFPRGGAELVDFLYNKSNQELSQIMAADVAKAKEDGEKIKITEFIRNAVQTRLQMILPYSDVWPQAMAIQALPQNAPESWSNTLRLVDDIWYYAGDRSFDMNWYSKRLTLFGVFKATEIFMLQDTSPEKENTWAFLDRRLKDVQKLGSAKKACEQNSDVLKEALKGFSIMGKNLLGFNSRSR